MNFSDKLAQQIKSKNNPSVLGLDPKLEYIPALIKEKYFNGDVRSQKAAAECIIEFNKRLIDALYEVIPAIKPQLAYYEMYGIEGIRAFYETIGYSKEKGLLVIADGKRNDIGTTAQAYATAYLGRTDINGTLEEAFGADSLTVNAYLGIDGIKPFIDACENNDKGIFVLVKTSNPSSGQLQDLKLQDGRTIYEAMADLVNEWGSTTIGQCGYSSVGAVVGATYPKQLEDMRKRMPKAWILVPGYGAQGGTAADVAVAFDKDGLGAVINASRSLMCAYKLEAWKDKFTHEDFAEAARAEAERMRDDINKEREKR
ncbi:MAG: orotidine-5'-phosphate decarboxylase [Clostridiaceae bacterium]|nr:orotidine-5'-phosphate decarboxylase [Clostridiaceae bacterium]